MRILIVSQLYPPEPVKVVEELATGLRELGHDVEVLTGFPNYPRGRIYPEYRLRPWMRERIRGILLHRVALYPDHGRSAVGRLLTYGSYAVAAALVGPLLVRKADVVYVYGSPATAVLPGWWLSRLWQVPLVVAVPDLWPEALQGAGVRNRFVLGAVARFARWAYRSAARVIAVSDGFARSLAEKGVREDRIRRIPVWVDVASYRPAEPDEEMRRRLGISRPVVVMYAGHIGLAQGLETVIEAADAIRDREEIEVVFVGEGIDRPALERKAAELNLTNVRFAGTFPPEEMSRVYAHASALLVHLVDDPVFRMWIPHKLFAYMAVGKPIVCAVAGETADIVRKAGAGLTCPPGDPQALADAVRKVADMPVQAREQLGRNGRRAAERDYDLRVLMPRVAAVLEEVATRPPATRI